MKRAAALLAQALAVVYFIPLTLFVPYYNWTYARDHGFVSWFCFGEVVATAKAIGWPYFAVASISRERWTEDEKENGRHIIRSFEAQKAAVKLINDGPPGYSTIPTAKVQDIVTLLRLALDEAGLAGDEILDKALPGLSKAFREKYQQSIEFELRSMNEADAAASMTASITASKLYDEWVDWINPRRHQLKIPK